MENSKAIGYLTEDSKGWTDRGLEVIVVLGQTLNELIDGESKTLEET